MRVLVTGSSGYIGQHLCKHLKSHDYEVWGVDNTFGDETYIDQFRCIDLKNENDLLAGGWHAMEFDAVIHLAAFVQVGESVKQPLAYYENNIQGTINAMRFFNYKNFVFASTGTAAQPNNPYALSKLVAEQCVRDYMSFGMADLPYTIFRFYNVIGSAGYEPTNPDGLFYNLMKAEQTGQFNLYGTDYNTPDGSAIRDYVHVLEICYALELAVRKPSCVPGSDWQPFVENLGSGQGHSVKDIIQIYKKVNNCNFNVNELPRRDGDLERSVLDNVSPYMSRLFKFEDILKR